MGCAFLKPVEEGEAPIFCHGEGVEPCSVPGCGVMATSLCDYPMGGGKTCDAKLCHMHAIAQRPFPRNVLHLHDDEDEGAETMEFCPTHNHIVHVSPPSSP